MNFIFAHSNIHSNIVEWQPLSLETPLSSVFYYSSVNPPYWAKYDRQEERNHAINAYHLKYKLEKEVKNDKYQKQFKL